MGNSPKKESKREYLLKRIGEAKNCLAKREALSKRPGVHSLTNNAMIRVHQLAIREMESQLATQGV